MSADRAASVLARLLNRSRSTGENYNLLLSRFVIERLLFRLSVSPHASSFVLKGALLFALWYDAPHRPTKDADLLGFGADDADTLRATFSAVCAIDADDGVRYDTQGMKVEPIREDNVYGGMRLSLLAFVGRARLPVQVDIGLAWWSCSTITYLWSASSVFANSRAAHCTLTIARQLHVHRDTVRRVLAQAGDPAPASPLRPSQVDPYRDFILQTLVKFPTLTAARLFDMVHERGYRGSAEHLRHLIAGMRPRPATEAFLRLRTLPGEQAQVDWGHFGHLQVGRARRPLMAFVMVLSYSRRIFLRFCLDARTDSFLRGHVEAFAAFRGVARVILYDRRSIARGSWAFSGNESATIVGRRLPVRRILRRFKGYHEAPMSCCRSHRSCNWRARLRAARETARGN